MLVVVTAQSQMPVLIPDVSMAPSSTMELVSAPPDLMEISVMNTSENVTFRIVHSVLMLIIAVNVLITLL